MQISATLFTAFALFSAAASGKSLRQESMDDEILSLNDGDRALQDGDRELTGYFNGRGRNRLRTLRLTITNESFNQPFGGFLVMVHNDRIDPMYVRGQAPTEALAILAENGDPSLLVAAYENNTNVLSAIPFNTGAPYFGGQSFFVDIEVSRSFPLVTIASMAINTNDCFVALNGVRLRSGMVLDVPGLDAGSEENNELCASIPGPGCASFPAGNVRSGNGEGFVHVHRGFFGVGPDLPDASRYDWRNPMMRVVVN